jgi:hypothetical protein
MPILKNRLLLYVLAVSSAFAVWSITNPHLQRLVASSVVPAAKQASSQVRLSISCQDSKYLTATVSNSGPEDTAVIFGTVLANGRKYLVDGLTLQVKPADKGRGEEYGYRPLDYPAAIGGRLDDWITSLPVGGAYTMTLEASQFWSSQFERQDTLPQNAQLSLRLPIRTPRVTSNPDMRLFRVWTGASILTSNEILVPQQCR